MGTIVGVAVGVGEFVGVGDGVGVEVAVGGGAVADGFAVLVEDEEMNGVSVDSGPGPQDAARRNKITTMRDEMLTLFIALSLLPRLGISEHHDL
ncbi:MAG: hypothetical protein GTO18_00270 [Anaerolineales bacterium]|nr:hypothetical protein [Anaerolineales bacterium]